MQDGLGRRKRLWKEKLIEDCFFDVEEKIAVGRPPYDGRNLFPSGVDNLAGC